MMDELTVLQKQVRIQAERIANLMYENTRMQAMIEIFNEIEAKAEPDRNEIP